MVELHDQLEHGCCQVCSWWTNRLEQRCWNHHDKSIAMFIHDRITYTCCQGMMNSQGWTAMLYNNHELGWTWTWTCLTCIFWNIQPNYVHKIVMIHYEWNFEVTENFCPGLYIHIHILYTQCNRYRNLLIDFFFRLPIAIAPCTDNNNCEQVCFTNISSNQQECSCNPGFKPRSDDNTKCDGK